MLALAALALALWARPRLVLPLFGARITGAACILAAIFAGLDVWARLQGQVWTDAAMTTSAPSPGETVSPAPGPPIVLIIATIGGIAALGLAVE